MKPPTFPQTQSSKPAIGIWRAVLIGWIIVNIPALIIMLGIFSLGMTIQTRLWWFFLFIGLVSGWAWWSYTVPRWRSWAHGRGTPAEDLQRLAVRVGLTWPKGSVFERTEFRIDKQ